MRQRRRRGAGSYRRMIQGVSGCIPATDTVSCVAWPASPRPRNETATPCR